MFKYRIFGLNVKSDIKLDCYPAHFDVADVEVRTVNKLDKMIKSDYFYLHNDNEYYLSISNVASFKISNSNLIEVLPIGDNSHSEIELFLLGSVFGSLMIQMGNFPLHGSVVEKNGVGIALIGDSGAGKSTLAGAFVRSGWRVVTDDVIRYLTEANVRVYPSYPSQKIWGKAAEYLSLNVTKSDSVINRIDKYYIKSKDRFSNKNVNLKYVFELVPQNIDKVKIKSVRSSEALSLMINNSYRYKFIEVAGKAKGHFKCISKALPYLKFYRIYRPIDEFTMDEQIESIMKVIEV